MPKSDRAIDVNVEIMRAFVRLRQLLATHTDLARKLPALEQKYDEQFKVVFDAIRALMAPPAKLRKKIGFGVKEKRAAYGRQGQNAIALVREIINKFGGLNEPMMATGTTPHRSRRRRWRWRRHQY